MAKPEIQFVGPVLDRRPKPPRNGYGKWGLLLPILSCGTLAPIGLLLSMRGLFSRPKTSAVLGTLLNGAICTFIFLPMSVHFAEHAERHHRRHIHAMQQQHEQDRAIVAKSIVSANERINEYVSSHRTLPDGISGNKLIFGVNDRWEQPLRYDVPLDIAATTYTIRSAGRDKKFETNDDIQIDFNTATSRNDAGTPTSTPADGPSTTGDSTEAAPLGQSLQRIEMIDRNGQSFVVVINR